MEPGTHHSTMIPNSTSDEEISQLDPTEICATNLIDFGNCKNFVVGARRNVFGGRRQLIMCRTVEKEELAVLVYNVVHWSYGLRRWSHEPGI